MKHLLRLLQITLTFLIFLPVLLGQDEPENWFKYYGDQADNFSEEAKLYGDGVYVAGSAVIPDPLFGTPVSYGTFSKLNPVTGEVIWEGRFDLRTRIEDFVHVPEDNTFLLVGHITPFQNDVDNASFIAKMDDQGDVITFSVFQNTGRESFRRIIRHPAPADVMAPYYVLGTANPENNAPSFVDVPILLNVDTGGGVNWRRELSAFGRELETVRGLSVAEDGHLLLLGNDIPENNGVVLKIRQDGQLDEAWAHPGSIDWYDATPLGDGNTVIVGERFAEEIGAIGLLDETSGTVFNGFQFPELTEIVRTGALTFPDTNLVAIYFTGRVNDFQLRTNVVGVTIYDPEQEELSAPFFFRPSSSDVQSIEVGKLFADNVNKRVVYTDTRETFSDGSIGIGKTDITVGVFPPGFSDANCLNSIDIATSPFSVEPQNIEADTEVGVMQITSGALPVLPIDYSCQFMCEPPESCPLSLAAAIESTDNCFQVNLIATPTGGTGPYVVSWDIGCDAEDVITTNELTVPYTFSPAQAYSVCVKITDAEGCTDSLVLEGMAEPCGEVVTATLNCRGDGNYQLFVNFDNGLPIPINACTYSVMVNEAFVDLIGPVQFVNGMIVVDVFTDEIVLEATATVQLISSCPCPDDVPTNCSLAFETPVECCLELSVPDSVICTDLATLEVPILGLDQLASPYDIQQVRYYVSSTPFCGTGGDVFQLTNGYAPLVLAPSFHDGNICVYAEVDLAGGGACSTIRTETARVQRCDPVSGAIPNQQFCYVGDPIIPTNLELTLSGGDPNLCGTDVQWFGPDGNPINGATGLTYQPNALSLPAGTTVCDELFTFRAEITSVCGTTSASSVIRIFNDDAPLRVLSIDAPDNPPLCPGEDAVIRYEQACTGDDMIWAWWERTGSAPYTSIAANGTQNPVYFTNRLREDTWYLVTKTNGSCPADSLEIFVDITDSLRITSFTANYSVACQPDFLVLDIAFTGQLGCADSIFYYRNGLLLAVQPTTMPSYNFAPVDDDISGNYYAIVRDICCNAVAQTEAVRVENPPGIAIGGPCFLCNSNDNDLPATLMAVPTGIDLEEVTLEWFVDGMPIGDPNASTLEIFDDTGDVYTLQMTTVNGCLYTASFIPYKRCFVVGVNNLIRVQGKVFPNPTTNQLFIETAEPVRFREIRFYDALGRPIRAVTATESSFRTRVSLEGLAQGVYILQAFTESGAVLVEEIVKK